MSDALTAAKCTSSCSCVSFTCNTSPCNARKDNLSSVRAHHCLLDDREHAQAINARHWRVGDAKQILAHRHSSKRGELQSTPYTLSDWSSISANEACWI